MSRRRGGSRGRRCRAHRRQQRQRGCAVQQPRRDILFRVDDKTRPGIRALGFDHTANPEAFVSLSLLIGSETRIVIEERGSRFKGCGQDAPDPEESVLFDVAPSGRVYESFDNLPVVYVEPTDGTAAVPLPVPALILLSGLAALTAAGGRRALSR